MSFRNELLAGYCLWRESQGQPELSGAELVGLEPMFDAIDARFATELSGFALEYPFTWISDGEGGGLWFENPERFHDEIGAFLTDTGFEAQWGGDACRESFLSWIGDDCRDLIYVYDLGRMRAVAEQWLYEPSEVA